MPKDRERATKEWLRGLAPREAAPTSREAKRVAPRCPNCGAGLETALPDMVLYGVHGGTAATHSCPACGRYFDLRGDEGK